MQRLVKTRLSATNVTAQTVDERIRRPERFINFKILCSLYVILLNVMKDKVIRRVYGTERT